MVVAYLEKLALSKPGIKFTLINNDKTVFKTSGSDDF
jgi:DNA mismatch repair ATPase MutL